VVTPKEGAAVRQPRAVVPALVVVGILLAVSLYGLARNQNAATINNVSFAGFHISVLLTGCWAALEKPKPALRAGRSRRGSRLIRAVVVAVGIALCFAVGCGGNSSPVRSSSKPQKKAESAGQRFLARYVTSDGRVSRIDQGGDTVGEGQAYGMLIAAAIGDSKRFDSIWGLDEEQPAAQGRADLVPVARRPNQGPAGGLGRRRGRRARAARGVVSLPPGPRSARKAWIWQRRS